MESKYESKIKVVKASAEQVYARLSDFSRLGEAMPKNLVQDWEATADDCHFSIDKLGRVGLKIVDREPGSTVKYGLDGSLPLDMNLWVQVKEVGEGDSRLKVTMKANLNPMVKMVVGSKLQQVVDQMADSMSRHNWGNDPSGTV